ncbi:MAG: acyl-CoA dehydratase activase-related protein [Proteobacteria bacterium]|nr:acyl-CoA dehydratase activase-related protein [Pseudomonadota bacterium]
MSERRLFAGIDVGAETIKYAVVEASGRVMQCAMLAHRKSVESALVQVLETLRGLGVSGVAVCGRFANYTGIRHYPRRAVQARGLSHLFGEAPLTYVTIGCNGFTVHERRGQGNDIFRENSRCSQGTGNFLRQLVERFDMDLSEADALCESVERPCALSGRCPVILKTDMTHLANRGERREEILAGVYDSICENVEALIKPSLCPKSIVLGGGVTRSGRIRRHLERFCLQHGLQLLAPTELSQFYVEALGCALLGLECGADDITANESQGVRPTQASKYDVIPGLRHFLSKVHRLTAPPLSLAAPQTPVFLGFDIGSTGSKAVALAAHGSSGLGSVVWEGYLRTNGNPVAAAKQLVSRFLAETGQSPAQRGQAQGVAPTDTAPHDCREHKTLSSSQVENLCGVQQFSPQTKPFATSPQAMRSIAGGVEPPGSFAGVPLAGGAVPPQKIEHAPLQVVGFGVTGSGREIVGSLLTTCFGASCVYVMNEIAAHAEGARAIEPKVDTIFEIGGQDAKYIRLSEGRIVDAAMNEACSAGTGSFIEEQGKKFEGFESLEALSQAAIRGTRGVSLGQHCSVFMSQVIEDAVAAGVETEAILAGIYDSVVLNYFYRVKGNRSVGEVVFCQGMPFHADALAAAVVRQTQADVIIPPNPGTIGAFGIARLAQKTLEIQPPLPLDAFMSAEISSRQVFVCNSNKGCGGSGNRCKIDKIQVQIGQNSLQFTWGGACSLWDKGSRNLTKLPNLSPDPFRGRQEVIDGIITKLAPRGLRSIAISEEFQNKSLFPFFATLFYELGFDVKVFHSQGLEDLKRGLDRSNVQFCAPMQHFQGLAARMAESDCDYLFLPMMRCGKFSGDEAYATICPVVQSCPDLLRHDLRLNKSRLISPVIDFGPKNLRDPIFRTSCEAIGKHLGIKAAAFERAFQKASFAQAGFEDKLMSLGRRALAFAKANDLLTVIVLGRNYTIHNHALNSNVPALLRELGAMAIPVDCYPIDEEEPLYTNIYWSYGQLNLRAATQIRKTPGQFALWCSNYGCGPDSFNLHFFQFIMQGKPYTVIETDGHSGDAGSKTRVEAFLHCTREYQSAQLSQPPQDLHALERQNVPLMRAIRDRATLLIPPMGDNAGIIAAGFRGLGADCRTLPLPTRKSLLLGRRYTSGKECLPMLITLGSLLEAVEAAPDDARLIFFMPRSNGPCRLGCYNLLDKIILKRLDLQDRVQVWSLSDTDYSEGVPMTAVIMIYTAFVACDTLMAALYDVRPVEARPGAARVVYDRHYKRLVALLENPPNPNLWQPFVAKEILSGTFFGIADILKSAARDFAAIKTKRAVPTVCLTGEIYVRNDPFANDFMIDALEKRGLRVRFAHFSEWLEYADIINRSILKTATSASDIVTSNIIRHILRAMYKPMAKALNWPQRHDVQTILNTAQPYLRIELVGEEILTLGTPLYAHQHGEIQGAVNVGPLECMPSKIAESQLYHVAEHDGLLSLTLAFNGDLIPDSVLDDFCFEVKRRFEAQQKL